MKDRDMPTARDLMTRRLVKFRPDTPIEDAVSVLVRRRVSGAPVVDDQGELVGVLSERDCLRVIAVGAYTATDHHAARTVSDFMTESPHTVSSDAGIYSLADFFLTHPIRRLPVMEGRTLVGIVSRRDVLSGIRKMLKRRELPLPEELRGPKLYPSATDASPGAMGQRLS